MFINLDNLIKKFSGPKDVLRNLCNKEKESTRTEIENTVKQFSTRKEYLIKEAKKLFQYEISSFKTPNSDFNYKLELMSNDDPDYNVLNNSLDMILCQIVLKKLY